MRPRPTPVLLDIPVLAIAVLTAVSFNVPEFGLGANERLVRTALQGFIIVAALASAVVCRREIRAFPIEAATKWLFLFAGFAAVSTLWSVDVIRTLTQSLAAIATVGLILVHSRQTGWHRTRRVLLVGFCSILVGSFVVEVMFPSGGALEQRWGGIVGAPTQLAQLSAITAALVLVGYMRHRESTASTLGILALCLGLIVASQSRVAFATTLIVLLIAVCLRSPKAARTPTAISVIALGASFTLIVSPLLSRLALRGSAQVGDLAALTGRTSIWPIALGRIGEQPVQGYGFASGEVLWAREVVLGNSNWNPTNAHQILVEITLSLGLVGLVIFFAFLVALFTQPHSSRRAPSVLLVLTLVGLGATESMVHFTGPAIPVLALAAVAAHATATSRTAQPMPLPSQQLIS